MVSERIEVTSDAHNFEGWLKDLENYEDTSGMYYVKVDVRILIKLLRKYLQK